MDKQMPDGSKTYAGIGSRETPEDVLRLMRQFGYHFARRGWILRSGGAPGADTAFYDGSWAWNTAAEIYLPWKGFNGFEGEPARDAPQEEAFEIAEKYHTGFKFLSQGAKKLIARNSHQILGWDVTNPVLSEFVICWTPQRVNRKGVLVYEGGTGQALRIAQDNGVTIYNLFVPSTKAFVYDMLY